MARANLGSMSVDALLTLRDDIGKVLSRKAGELRDQLLRLGGEIVHTKRGRRSSLKGRKAPIKYRDRSGNTWAGRGATPIWLREKLKGGAKLEDFAVHKTAVSRKSSHKKSKKRRKTKSRKVKRAVKRQVKRRAAPSKPAEQAGSGTNG